MDLTISAQKQAAAPAQRRADRATPSENDSIVEETDRLTGGHRIGGLGPTDLFELHRDGCTVAQELASWTRDIGRWNEAFQSVLRDLQRLQARVATHIASLRQHARLVSNATAEQARLAVERRDGTIRHSEMRRRHAQVDERCRRAMPGLWAATRAIQEALASMPLP